jgi:hypothetical protein
MPCVEIVAKALHPGVAVTVLHGERLPCPDGLEVVSVLCGRERGAALEEAARPGVGHFARDEPPLVPKGPKAHALDAEHARLHPKNVLDGGLPAAPRGGELEHRRDDRTIGGAHLLGSRRHRCDGTCIARTAGHQLPHAVSMLAPLESDASGWAEVLAQKRSRAMDARAARLHRASRPADRRGPSGGDGATVPVAAPSARARPASLARAAPRWGR